jgi:hypothetical protein
MVTQGPPRRSARPQKKSEKTKSAEISHELPIRPPKPATKPSVPPPPKPTVPSRTTQSSKLILNPLQTPLRPRNTSVSHQTDGCECSDDGYSTTHEDLDAEESCEDDENNEEFNQSHDEEKEDFEPVRKSPRKPIPTQKGLEYYHSRLSRVPDNPKGVSIDRSDRQNSLCQVERN